MRLYRGSNSAGRRKYRRAMLRIWENSPAKWTPGTMVKITVAHYGKSYENTKATVIGKGTGYNTYVVQSNRRKSPMVIQIGHLAEVA